MSDGFCYGFLCTKAVDGNIIDRRLQSLEHKSVRAQVAVMSGRFIYPPPNSQDVTLNYNYRDSVEVSFETTTSDQIDPYLSIWYYLDGQPWKLGTFS